MSSDRIAEYVALRCNYCGMAFTVPPELLSMVTIVCACGVSRSEPLLIDGGEGAE